MFGTVAAALPASWGFETPKLRNMATDLVPDGLFPELIGGTSESLRRLSVDSARVATQAILWSSALSCQKYFSFFLPVKNPSLEFVPSRASQLDVERTCPNLVGHGSFEVSWRPARPNHGVAGAHA